MFLFLLFCSFFQCVYSMQCTVCIQLYQQQKTLQAPRTVLEIRNTQKLETKTNLRWLHLFWPCAISDSDVQDEECILRVYHIKVLALREPDKQVTTDSPLLA